MDDIVIDTHIAIWYFADATQLSKPAETAIDNAEANGIILFPRSTVPEMPDRIIAATALYLHIPLITKDHKIQALQSIQTIW